MSTVTFTQPGYAALPITRTCTTPANPDEKVRISKDDEAPRLISRSLSIEHEVFVAYLKRFVGHKSIVSRLLETFPDLVQASGCNARAKLFKKLDAIDFWMGIKGPTEEEVYEHRELFAKLAVIDAWVGNYTSRWAPVQDPSEEMVRGFAWGPALIVELSDH
ncbi:hypothetical protein MMC11_005227 [Xylographa trunciseda]|nr:hypothetical protein [Xylographa trunciseda]